ncbi:MAG: polysaccharide biosynthesis protein, partial [Actinobacteria bacterium]
CFAVALLPVLVVATVAAALLFLFSPDVAGVLIRKGERDLAVDLLHVFGLFLPVAAVTTLVIAGTRGFGTMVPVTVLDRIGQPALRTILLVIAVALGAGGIVVALSWTLPLVLELGAGLAWLLLLARSVEERSRRSEPAPVRAVFTEFWSFTAFRGLAAFLHVMVDWFDVLLVGALASGFAAGVYGAVSRLIFAGAFIQRALILALGPQISTLLARGEKDRARVVYQTATAWLILVSFPVFLTVAIFAPTVLRIFGSGFEAGRTALVIISLATLVNMATGPVTTILVMAGRSSWNLGNAAVSVTLNVALNVVLVPRYGITGAAIAWAVSIVVQNLLPVVQIWRFLDLHPFGFASIASAAAAAGCFGLVGLAVRSAWGTSLAALIVSFVSSTLLYFGFAWSFRGALSLPLLASTLRFWDRAAARQHA